VGEVVIVVQNILYASLPNHYSEVHVATPTPGSTYLDELTLCEDAAPVVTSVAGCDLIACLTEGPDIVGLAYASLVGTLVDVGPIAVTSGGTSATVTQPDTYTWANHDWNTPPPAGFVWQSGASIEVAGGGTGDLPAFDRTLAFPPSLTVTGALAASGTIAISASSPVAVTWTAPGLTSGTATIELTGAGLVGQTGMPWLAAICRAPVSAGSFALPPALLAHFATDQTALLTVSTDVRASAPAGATPVSVATRDVTVADVVFGP
jgi:hypothetical protein